MAISKSLIPKRGLGQRYKRHPKTIDRWVAQEVIPPPDAIINGKGYWDEEKLDQHDRESVAASASRKAQGPRTTAS